MLISEIKEIIDKTELKEEDILKYTMAILSKEVTNIIPIETQSAMDYTVLMDLVINDEDVICAITNAIINYASLLF